MNSLSDRTVIITGASSGIGRESAKKLAESGANLVLAARREDRLVRLRDQLEAEYGTTVTAKPTDITDKTQVEDLVATAIDTYSSLYGVVNNAGTVRPGAVAEIDDEAYHTMIDVNINGVFYTTRAALPHLRESNGTVVFIGSYAGKYPKPGNPVYGATKWWIRGFALSLAGQVGADRVGVSVINPSEVRTEFGAARGEISKERYDEGEVTDPSAIAEAVQFALSQDKVDEVVEMDLYRRDKFSDY